MRVRSATGQCLGRRSRSTVNCPGGVWLGRLCARRDESCALGDVCRASHEFAESRRGITAESGLTPWRRGLVAGLCDPRSGESSLPYASSQMHLHAEYVLAEIVRIAA